jgi:hypothetical protein
MHDDLTPLDERPRHNIFQTPEGYFDQLPSRIQARTQRATARAPLVGWSWRRTWLGLGAAGLVAALVYLSVPVRQDTIGPETLGPVGTSDIVGYLSDRNLTTHDVRFFITTGTDEQRAEDWKAADTLSPVQQLKITEEDIRQHLRTEDLTDHI